MCLLLLLRTRADFMHLHAISGTGFMVREKAVRLPAPHSPEVSTGSIRLRKAASRKADGSPLLLPNVHAPASCRRLHQVLGSLYVLAFLADELGGGGAWVRAEAAHGITWPAVAILWMGVANCISCLPMSKFTRGAPAPLGRWWARGLHAACPIPAGLP